MLRWLRSTTPNEHGDETSDAASPDESTGYRLPEDCRERTARDCGQADNQTADLPQRCLKSCRFSVFDIRVEGL